MTEAERRNFCDVLFSAQEIIFTFHNFKYCVQGYHQNGKAHMYLSQWEPESPEPSVWECTADLMRHCGEQFLEAPIFNGKTFWEVESEITWVDE